MKVLWGFPWIRVFVGKHLFISGVGFIDGFCFMGALGKFNFQLCSRKRPEYV